MNVQIVVNFDLSEQGVIVEFPHSGTRYDYYAHGASLDVSSNTVAMTLQPGEFRLFTDVQIENPLITSVGEETMPSMKIYPNPVDRMINVEPEHEIIYGLTLRNLSGQQFSVTRSGLNQWDTGELPSGFYVTEIRTSKRNYRIKIVKR